MNGGLGIALLFGWWVSSIAKKQGRSSGWGFFWGFFGGIIAVIVYYWQDKRA